MSNRKILLYGLIAFVVWYYVRVTQAAKNLTYGLGKIKAFKISATSISWLQDVEIGNFQNIPIPLQSATLYANVQGFNVGTAALNGTQVIGMNGITPIQFIVRIGITDLINAGLSVAEIIQDKEIQLGYSGTIRALGVNIPVQERFSVNLKKKQSA